MSLFDLTSGLRSAARQAPTRPATIDGVRLRDWRTIAARCRARGAHLLRRGLRPGDRVALLGVNSDAYFEAMFACLWAGLVIVPLNRWWSDAELAFAMADSGAAAVLADPDQMDRVSPRGQDAAWALFDLREDGFAPHGGDEDLIPPADRKKQSSRCAAIFYTGGTTGTPKGVVLSGSNLWAGAQMVGTAAGLSAGARYLHAAPMFHLADAAMAFAVSLHGGAHVFVPAFEPAAVLAAIAAHEVTHVLLVPTMISRLIEHPDFDPAAFASVRRLIYGAAPMPLALLERLQVLLPQVGLVQAYGQTELSPVATVLGPEDHVRALSEPRVRNSAGKPVAGVELKIVDADLREAAGGVIGQIAVRGPNATAGYWRRETETGQTVVNGWVMTGDLGFLDEEGFLHVVDRCKDMIISGGENVYSAEVENAISSHPDILECAVIAAPDPDLVERVHAVVVLRDGAVCDAATLRAHCRERIAGYKCPRTVEFRREPLPKSAAGKILKSELRASVVAQPSLVL